MEKPYENFSDLLRKYNYKATPGRLAILKTLASSPKPLSVQNIYQKLKSKTDKVTVYRTLEALADTDIVSKINFQRNHAYYELAEGREHHHHILCRHCGKIEDIQMHDLESLEKAALKKTKSFSSIKSHSLEFFGLCKKCS